MPRRSISILLKLSRLTPTAERLRELVWAFAGWGYDSVYLDWNDAFPWSADQRFRSSSAYREELVSGLFREAEGWGIALVSLLPAADELGFVYRLTSYRHLFHSDTALPLLDLAAPAGRSFLKELVEDYLALVPDTSRLAVGCQLGALPDDVPELLAEVLSGYGLESILRFRGSVGSMGGERRMEAVDLSSFSQVILPAEFSSAAGSRPKRVAREYSFLPVLNGPDAAAERARTDGGELIFSFQPDVRDQAMPPAAAPIPFADSIELSLSEVCRLGAGRAAGEPSRPRSTGSPSRACAEGDPLCAILARELEASLLQGWSDIRALREGVVSHRNGRGRNERNLRAGLARLATARRAAAETGAQLHHELSRYVNPESVSAAISSHLMPLKEEYFALLPSILGLEEEGP